MRLINALLHAMRTRRTQRIDLDQADRWVAGEHPGPDHQGLAELLAAAQAPATAEELAGERAAVAAFAAEHRRAASPVRARSRVLSRTSRTVVVNVAAVLALVGGAGTAVAARTGNLPDGAQQHAHRLFSALGVPAPRTGPPGPAAPAPPITSPPSPTPTPTTARPATPTPGASTTSRAEEVTAGWCRAWSASSDGGDGEWRRRLIEAAGGEERIPAYCSAVTAGAQSRSPRRTAAPTSQPGGGNKPEAKPSGGRSPGKPSSLPTPGKPGNLSTSGKPGNLPTPDHPGKKK